MPKPESLYKSILNQHNITAEEFDNSFKFYSGRYRVNGETIRSHYRRAYKETSAVGKYQHTARRKLI